MSFTNRSGETIDANLAGELIAAGLNPADYFDPAEAWRNHQLGEKLSKKSPAQLAALIAGAEEIPDAPAPDDASPADLARMILGR